LEKTKTNLQEKEPVMVEKTTAEPQSEPLIHDEHSDWRAIAESTVDTPQAGQQDQADEPPLVDGGTG